MQISAIKNNLINNYMGKPSKKQVVTEPAIKAELPNFADAKSLANLSFKALIHTYAATGAVESLKKEIEKGANVNEKNDGGNTPLMIASVFREPKIVKELLKSPDIDVNIRSRNYNTALTFASNNGSINIVKQLLQRDDIDVNAKSSYGYSALHLACHENFGDIVDELLKHKDIDVNTQTDRGATPLSTACIQNNKEIALKLLQRSDVDVNAQESGGWNPLLFAATNGSAEITENLIRHPNINVNVRDDIGNTPLIRACAENQPEVVEKILQHPDVDTGIKNNQGYDAMYWARYRDFSNDLIQMLENYERGVDRRGLNGDAIQNTQQASVDINAKDKDGNTALIRACADGKLNEVEQLLQNPDIDVNIQGKYRESALYIAAFNGHTDVVEKLIQHPDINMNLQNNDGKTALISAAANGHYETVEALLKHPDVDVNIKDDTNATATRWTWRYTIKKMIQDYKRGVDRRATINQPSVGTDKENKDRSLELISACRDGKTDEVERLLQNPDIDINAFDKDGNTALMLASIYGRTSEVEQLLQNPNINVNLRDACGCTALMCACANEQTEVVEKLIQRSDVDINIQDLEGNTALILASHKGNNAEIVEKLIRHPDIDVNKQNNRGNTALSIAGQWRYTEIVEKILQHPDVDTKIKNRWGNDVLYYTSGECKQMIKSYVRGVDRRTSVNQQSSDTNAFDETGITAFQRACIWGEISEIEKMLQNPEVDINKQSAQGNTALILACNRGRAKVAEILLQQPGIDVNAQNEHGDTALMFAAVHGYADVAEKLLQHPAIDTTIKNNKNCDAIFYATARSDKPEGAKIAEMISNYIPGLDKRKNPPQTAKKSGFDVNATDRTGKTYLMKAVINGRLDDVECLLKNPDIDVNIKDKNEGKTALLFATNSKYDDIAIKLIEHPETDVNAQDDEEKQTPLIWAIRNLKLDVVGKLLERPDIDVNIQDKDGRTALFYAALMGYPKIMEKLLEHPDIDVTIQDINGHLASDYNFSKRISEYQRGIDGRKELLKVTQRPPININKLSPEENIWSEDEISKHFQALIKAKRFEDAETMLQNTPLIDLSDNGTMDKICLTGKSDFVQKVFRYKDNQPKMRTVYDRKRTKFLNKTIMKLSYDELKENNLALHTDDGFKILMSNPKFNPNDMSGDNSLFEYACQLDTTGKLAKQILSKYDDVYTQRAQNASSDEIRGVVNYYETRGKYQLKFDNIKRNLSNPETRDIAVTQIKDFINSADFKPDMADSLGNSLLHIVSSTPDDNARGLIQKLIDKGVNINAKNITNQNSLVSAIKAFRIARTDEDKTKLLSNIKFLLDKGIDINAPDNNGQTAFHHACSTTSVALLNMILDKKPQIFEKDKLGHKGSFYLSTPQMKETYNNYVN